jgi:hypothetical protein
MILKENLDIRFSYLKKIGIKTIAGLLALLKKKGEIKELSKQEFFSEEYLTVLLRHLKGLQAKPRKLDDFKWISADIIKKLQNERIKNTKQLYEVILTRKSRKDLVNKLCVNEKEVLKLIKQTDLTRIQWVNSTFAQVLYEAGYDTVEKVKKANSEILYKKILEINKAKNLYKGNIGLNDMKICIEAANEVDFEIEY